MRVPHDRDSGSIDDLDAQTIIRRAAELQALDSERTSVHELKRMAEEVGIDPQYIEEALLELRNRNPRAFTTTISSPLPFGVSPNGRPLDPIERKETLEFLAAVNDHGPLTVDETTSRLSRCPPTEFERRVPIDLRKDELNQIAAWLSQRETLQGPIVLTGSALVATLNLGWVFPRLQIVSRSGRSRLSIMFRSHASRELAVVLALVTLMTLSISVLSGELLFAFLGVFTLLLCIGVYAHAGHRARNKARRLLDDLNSFVQTLI